ncbi:MAG: hypothetical protein ABR987_20335, partial [Terracidiphilus sp.]
IGSRLCSTLPSDPASRRRPCASLSLLLHQDVKGTYTPKLSIMRGVLSMMAIRGIAMAPLAIWVVACEFSAAIAFGLVLDVVKIPVFARLRIS